MSEVQILTLSCRDRAGITARVTGYLYDKGGNILEAQQYNDQAGGDFFMRVEFDPQAADPATIRAGFAAIADEYGMTWTLRAKSARRKVVLMVSKFDHCLGDLLYRVRIGELAMDVVAVIGNHPREALNISLLGDVPYHHFPITKDTKPQQEAQIKEIIEREKVDLASGSRDVDVDAVEVLGVWDQFKNLHRDLRERRGGAVCTSRRNLATKTCAAPAF